MQRIMALITLFGQDDDDPALLFRLQHIIAGAIRYGRPRHAHIVKIDNWFGPRWRCFAGSPGGADLHPEDRLAIPPFALNRVVSETTYVREGDHLSRVEPRSLHQDATASSRTIAPRYLDERSHSGVFVWYSGKTRRQDRASLMVYDVEKGGEQRAWYVELQKRGGTWTVATTIGTSQAEIEDLETSYGNRLARLLKHPADQEHEDDQSLWRLALEASLGPQVAKAAVLIQQYKARHPDSHPIRLLNARNLAHRRLFGAAEAEFRAVEHADGADERWRSMWLHEWVEFCELRRDEVGLEAAYRELAMQLPGDTRYWILLGACLARQGKLEAAMEMHRRATTLAGDPDEAFLNLGLLLRAAGRFEEAADALQRALDLCSDDLTAADALADVREAMRLRDGAEP